MQMRGDSREIRESVRTAGIESSDVERQHINPKANDDDYASDGSLEMTGRERPGIELPGDVFGLVLMSSFVDVNRFVAARHNHARLARLLRVFYAYFLLWINMAMQIYLLYAIKKFITCPAVDSIQKEYSKYEDAVYDQTILWTDGEQIRGVQGAFNQTKFDGLSSDFKETICNIPLSNPEFLGIVLLIWTLTVFQEIISILELSYAFIWHVETSHPGIATPTCEENEDEQATEIKSLPLGFKVYAVVFIFIPRLIVALLLLWLGCRWLTATPSFSDIILNACALEFIITTKDLLYNTVVSDRTKRDVESCKARTDEKLVTSWTTFLAGIGYFVAGLAWTWCYLYYFQQVLPNYNFDVRKACKSYINHKYRFTFP